MEQGGLTLPSHTYYLDTDPASKAKVRALHQLVSGVLALLGHEEEECTAAADRVVEVSGRHACPLIEFSFLTRPILH